MPPPATQTSFAERLKAARLEAGLTNRQLALAVEVAERDIYRWQSGIEPRWRMVVKLAEVLGKPVSYFNGKDEA